MGWQQAPDLVLGRGHCVGDYGSCWRWTFKPSIADVGVQESASLDGVLGGVCGSYSDASDHNVARGKREQERGIPFSPMGFTEDGVRWRRSSGLGNSCAFNGEVPIRSRPLGGV